MLPTCALEPAADLVFFTAGLLSAPAGIARRAAPGTTQGCMLAYWRASTQARARALGLSRGHRLASSGGAAACTIMRQRIAAPPRRRHNGWCIHPAHMQPVQFSVTHRHTCVFSFMASMYIHTPWYRALFVFIRVGVVCIMILLSGAPAPVQQHPDSGCLRCILGAARRSEAHLGV